MGVRFSDCELSTERMELRRVGDVVDVEPQVFEVLAYLLSHRERMVPKAELLDQVWGNRFVSESALSSRIKSARRAVGDTGRDQRIIKTIYGRGYRFVADVADQPTMIRPAGGQADTADPAAGGTTIPTAQVLRAVSGVARGMGAAIQVSGGTGSGKTQLLRQVAKTARHQGLAIGLSVPRPSDGSPYLCVAEVLEEMAEQAPGLLDVIPAACRAELKRAFDGQPPMAPQHWYMAVREFLVAAAERAGAMVLLDDLHLAHPDALRLVDDVAQLARTCPLAIVVAQRPDAQARSGFEIVELVAGHQPRTDQHASVDPAAEVAEALRLGATPARIADLLIARGEPAMAVPYALEAARTAALSGLHAEVLRLTEAVRDHADGPAEAALLSLRADALASVGDHAAVPAYRKAIAVADLDQVPGLRTRLARAAVLCGDLASAQEALAGLEPTGGPDDGALLLARGMLAFHSGDIDGADMAVEAARALALAPGAPDRLLDVITLQGLIAHSRGEWFDRLRRELRGTRENPRLASVVFDSHLCVAEYLLYGLTAYDEVVALTRQLREQAEQAGARRGVAFAMAVAGEAALLAGDLETARGDLTESLALHEQMGADAGRAHALQRLAEVELAVGNRAAAQRLLRRALPLARWSPIARHLLQRIYGTLIAAASDAGAALAVLDEAVGRLDEPSSCMFCQVMIAVPASIACAEGGRLDEARSWLAQAEDSAARWQGTAWQGAVTEARAHLVRVEGDSAAASRLLAEAMTLFELAGQPLDAQRCLDAVDP